MVNKKVYNNPEFTVSVVEDADVLTLSKDPIIGDVDWASDVVGGSGDASY